MSMTCAACPGLQRRSVLVALIERDKVGLVIGHRGRLLDDSSPWGACGSSSVRAVWLRLRWRGLPNAETGWVPMSQIMTSKMRSSGR